MKKFGEIQKSMRLQWFFVTYDQEEAMVLGDKIAIMDQGKLVQIEDLKKCICIHKMISQEISWEYRISLPICEETIYVVDQKNLEFVDNGTVKRNCKSRKSF